MSLIMIVQGGILNQGSLFLIHLFCFGIVLTSNKYDEVITFSINYYGFMMVCNTWSIRCTRGTLIRKPTQKSHLRYVVAAIAQLA